jgi:hypothetical protein
MTKQRLLFEIINFLMALLFVIPLGVFVEQICGYPLYRCCFIPCLAVIGFLFGRASLTSSIQKAMILSGIGFVLSTALALILSWGLGLATVLLTLLTAFFSMFFYFSARKAAYTIYAPMAVGGILLHLLVLLCCEGFYWSDAVGKFTSTVSICFFLLTLFAFSAKGLRRSMHRGSADKRVVYPAGMQMGNFLLVAGFILVAAFISNIYPIFKVFSQGFAIVLKGLIAMFGFFTGLFDRRTISTTVTEDEAATEVSAEDNIMNVEPKGEASWLTTGVEIFAFICVVLFFLYAAYKLVQKMRERGVQLPGFLRNLRDKFAPVVDEDYEDEAESLFDMKKMLSDTKDNMKNALKKIRERPQKLEDFPDDRMKIRFVFQQMLKRVKLRDPGAAAKTPNEIYHREYEGEEEFRTFLDYYNTAKYSDAPLPPDAAERAKSILKQKL